MSVTWLPQEFHARDWGVDSVIEMHGDGDGAGTGALSRGGDGEGEFSDASGDGEGGFGGNGAGAFGGIDAGDGVAGSTMRLTLETSPAPLASALARFLARRARIDAALLLLEDL